jgi:signal transduction histidine kinase
MGVTLMCEMDENRLFYTVAHAACELTKAQSAVLTLRSVDVAGHPFGPVGENVLRLGAVVGATPEQEVWFRRVCLGGNGVLAPLFGHGVSVCISDLENSNPQQYRMPVRSFLGVPLLNREQEVVGALLLGHEQPGCFGVEDEALLIGLAAQAAVALENVRLLRLTKRADFQERLQLEELSRREALSTMLEELPGGVFIIQGEDERIILANRAATAVWGVPWCRNQPYRAFLEENQIHIFDHHGRQIPFEQLAITRVMRTGEPVHGVQEIVRQANGNEIPLVLNATVLDTGNWLSTIVREGIDSSKNDRLVVVAHQDVSALLEAERVKDEFIGIAAHELRTPLAVLRCFVQTLTNQTEWGNGALLEDWQKDALQGINQSTQRMATLVDDLLDVSRVQSGRLSLHIEPCNVIELVQRVVKRLQMVTDKHQFVLATPFDYLVVMADVHRMEQVLDNLLSNAIKYSPAGGPIDLNVCVCEEIATAPTVLLSIHDYGIGIPTEQQSHIFNRFHRANNVREIDGSGLGLYVSRALIELQHGQIWFDSAENQGSTFYITLPLYKEEATS